MSITQETSTTRQRAEGCFLGSAVGDALGATLEFMPHETILETYGGPLTDIIGGGCWNVRPGQITDDTEMALGIARSLALVGSYHPYSALYQYLEWFNTDPFDVGATCRNALYAAQQGFPAELASEIYHNQTGKSAGNGSLMRQTPLYIRYKDNLEALETAIRQDTKLTHYDQLASDASVFFSRQVARLINDPSSELETPEDELIKQYFLSSLQDIDAIVYSQMGFCLTGLAVACYAAKHAQSFEEGLVWAVNLGGDTDTNGAIAGAILGAKFGVEAIPERWLEKLEPREEITKLTATMLGQVQDEISF